MQGGSGKEAQHVGSRRTHSKRIGSIQQPVWDSTRSRAELRRGEARRVVAERRAALDVGSRRVRPAKYVYLARRVLALSLLVLGLLAVVLALILSGGRVEGRGGLPIDPQGAGPDAVLAEVSGVSISTPVRPEDLTALGYHPEGESLLALSPRGRNLSGTGLLGLFGVGSTPEKIEYHLMDRADRPGPRTGALDVGAEAGTPVYAPVDGQITAIRPDPTLPEGANIVEIRPADNPDLRVSVSLVREIRENISPKTPVERGKTELGSVADSARVLKPQLATEVSGAGPGNHVTVSVSSVN
jgi:hypothetical protein